jgi:hypothetical protein
LHPHFHLAVGSQACSQRALGLQPIAQTGGARRGNRGVNHLRPRWPEMPVKANTFQFFMAPSIGHRHGHFHEPGSAFAASTQCSKSPPTRARRPLPCSCPCRAPAQRRAP